MTTSTLTAQAIDVSLDCVGLPSHITMKGYAPGHALQSYVPTAKESDTYVHRKEFLREYRSWHNDPGDFAFMVVGPTGSGKTTAVQCLNKLLNIPTILVSCHAHMTLLELKSTMHFKAENGGTSTEVELGPVAFAFKHGCTLILDEVNSLDPGVSIGLNEIIRGETMVIESTGEIIQRHEMFRAIATGNDWGRGEGEHRLAGLSMQNAAFLNRFWKFKMGYPTADEESLVLTTKFPAISKTTADGMVEVATRLRAQITGVGGMDASLDFDMSTRTLLLWANITQRFANSPKPLQYGLECALMRSLNDIERSTVIRTCQDVFGEQYFDEHEKL